MTDDMERRWLITHQGGAVSGPFRSLELAEKAMLGFCERGIPAKVKEQVCWDCCQGKEWVSPGSYNQCGQCGMMFNPD